jgi:hypothetical protein
MQMAMTRNLQDTQAYFLGVEDTYKLQPDGRTNYERSR